MQDNMSPLFANVRIAACVGTWTRVSGLRFKVHGLHPGPSGGIRIRACGKLENLKDMALSRVHVP